MQNKRGISQAFSQVPSTTSEGAVADVRLRAATVFDAFDLSAVLCDSITSLCAADHQADPACLERWLADKTPQDIRTSIIAGHIPIAAEINGVIAGVGLTTPQGSISLLYVAPWAAGQGLGQALLATLEAELTQQGHTVAHLTATQTALGFYQSHGWVLAGPRNDSFGLPGQPMRKLLQPAG